MEDEDYDPYWDIDEEDPCDHDNFDADILSGRAFCYKCGHAWSMTTAEMEAEMRFQCEYQESVANEHGKIIFQIADINEPNPEPFMVLRIDPDDRVEDGLEATIISFHMTKDEAESACEVLREFYNAKH